jgi:Na+-translocating ferredoxin:NAD+ oxidoreductase RnfG subunit
MKNYLTILILLIISNEIFPNEIQNTCEQIIKDYFGKNAVYSYVEFNISDNLRIEIEKKSGQKFFKNKVIVWYISGKDSVESIAILDNVYGKSLPITFLVFFDLNGNILKSEIVKYRESYGGGVVNESWLKQFNNRNCSSSFEVGSEIYAVSGATISSNSVTRGVKKLSYLAKEIIRKNEFKTASFR